MEYKKIDNKLTLYFVGELNSGNADLIEKECQNIIEKNEFDDIVLDFADLQYISSAGLRIILRLKQKYQNVSISQVSLQVYDILQMTGFTNIISCSKKLNNVSIENAQIVGEGYFSTVYRIDKDTIIKVFNKTDDIQQIERELKLAKTAFVLGVPTAISFDVVKVDQKYGVRFEMLDCSSLKNCFLDDSNKYDYLVQKYADLLKKINTTECLDLSIPNLHDIYLQRIEKIKKHLTSEQYKKLISLFTNLKNTNTLVHGDCHLKNIMVQGEELILIDMDTLSRGNPIFELAQLRGPYVAFEEDEPGNCEKFFGIKSDFAQKLFSDIINLYFKNVDQKLHQKIALVCYLYMIWWTCTNTPENQTRINGCKQRLVDLLQEVDDLNIGEDYEWRKQKVSRSILR